MQSSPVYSETDVSEDEVQQECLRAEGKGLPAYRRLIAVISAYFCSLLKVKIIPARDPKQCVCEV